MGCNLCFSIISIHAPTRGATYQQVHFTVAYIIFQSTLPREERLHCPLNLTIVNLYFNPRSHERSDHDRHVTLWDLGISIHAPTRGATKGAAEMTKAIRISIHAPTRGATMCSLPLLLIHTFQSTLPREERQQYCTKNLFIFIQYRQ